MFKTQRFEDRDFKPLAIAVIAVSDTRTLETDTGGALLKSLMEGDGHICAERAIVRDDVEAIRAVVKRWVDDPQIDVAHELHELQRVVDVPRPELVHCFT